MSKCLQVQQLQRQQPSRPWKGKTCRECAVIIAVERYSIAKITFIPLGPFFFGTVETPT
jgi:hypothetical protein